MDLLSALQESCRLPTGRIPHSALANALDEAIRLYLTKLGWDFNDGKPIRPTSQDFSRRGSTGGGIEGSGRVSNLDPSGDIGTAVEAGTTDESDL